MGAQHKQLIRSPSRRGVIHGAIAWLIVLTSERVQILYLPGLNYVVGRVNYKAKLCPVLLTAMVK